jgi:hypothetical protein
MYDKAVGSRDKVPNSNFGLITGCAFLYIYLYLLGKCQVKIFRKYLITHTLLFFTP